jgi:RNA polymerase sigma-70 factor (ECF subfamily)
VPPAVDPRSDPELVDALNRGDLCAFDSIYWRHRDWVVRLAYRFTRSHDDALDVLQETFAYLARRFPGFRLTASLTTYLYPIVKNLSISILRKRRPTVQIDESSLSAPAVDSPVELAAVLRVLPEQAREVLVMRFVDGLELKEIAQALSVPLGTVKSRLHNALHALRDDVRTRRYFDR